MTDLEVTQNERKVLEVYAYHLHHNTWCDSSLYMSDIARDSGIQRPQRYVRALARKGYLRLEPIFDEASLKVCGSGYCLTAKGEEFIERAFQPAGTSA